MLNPETIISTQTPQDFFYFYKDKESKGVEFALFNTVNLSTGERLPEEEWVIRTDIWCFENGELIDSFTLSHGEYLITIKLLEIQGFKEENCNSFWINIE